MTTKVNDDDEVICSSEANAFQQLTSREIELLADGLRALPGAAIDAALVESLLVRLDVAQAMTGPGEGAGETVIAALAETVRRLKRENRELQDALERSQAGSLESMLGQLRLHGAVLLFIGGTTSQGFEQHLAETFGNDIARPVMQHLFDLNRSPLDAEQRAALRAALNGGLCRW